MSDDQLQNIERLLENVGAKVEKSEEIARLKGENFNIFSILGVETKENKTHSNFLTSLLNPKGEHGLGDVFLRHFYDMILPIISSEDGVKQNIVRGLINDSVVVKTEDPGGADGGRVDISIRGSGDTGIIFIENKIYAGDQFRQIARYSKNHDAERKIVFYLTLDGHSPSEGSTTKKDGLGSVKADEDFFLLSYQTDVIYWLEKCQKEASDYPIIRETIKQYLILIKKLTGQLTSSDMKEEIIEKVLSSKANYDSAHYISNLIIDIDRESYKKIIDSIQLFLLKDNLSIDRSRTGRLDGGFIPVIQHNGYDIGIQIELRNDYFFFCVAEFHKPRNPKINKDNRFDSISAFLIGNLVEYPIKRGRSGYTLVGDIHFEHKFNPDSRFSEPDSEFSTKLVTQILNYINYSRIKEFID